VEEIGSSMIWGTLPEFAWGTSTWSVDLCQYVGCYDLFENTIESEENHENVGQAASNRVDIRLVTSRVKA
jgi:hypothetical protein